MYILFYLKCAYFSVSILESCVGNSAPFIHDSQPWHMEDVLHLSIIHHSSIQHIISHSHWTGEQVGPCHLAMSLCPDKSLSAQTCPFLLRIWPTETEKTLGSRWLWEPCRIVVRCFQKRPVCPHGALWLNRGHQSLSSSPFQLISSAGERSRVLQKKKRERTRVKKGNRWPPPVEAAFEIADPLVDTLSDICVSSMQ